MNLIEEILRKDSHKYPIDEKRSAAGEGMAKGLLNCERYPGAEYAFVIREMKKGIENGYVEYWKQKQIESNFSIDKFFLQGDSEIVEAKLSSLRTGRFVIDDIICWKDFCESLDADLHRLLTLTLEGYNMLEICDMEKLEYDTAIEKIQIIIQLYKAYSSI